MVVKGIRIEVVRKPIKNLHLAVYPPRGAIRASVPERLDDADVRSFLLMHLDWIRRQSAEVRATARQSRRRYESGESHYLFGKRHRLRVEPLKPGKTKPAVAGGVLKLPVRAGADAVARRRVLEAWERELLRDRISGLLETWTTRTGEKPVRWRIQRLRSKWGSCTHATRTLRFNLDLVRVPAACIEYVVVHELVHLSVPDHSPAFRRRMDRLLPRWRETREDLNRFVAPAWEHSAARGGALHPARGGALDPARGGAEKKKGVDR